MTLYEAQHYVPDPFAGEDLPRNAAELLNSDLREAAPLLEELRAREHVLVFGAPEGAIGSDGKPLPRDVHIIQPYYMNHSDPTQLNILKMQKVDDEGDPVFIFTAPDAKGVKVELSSVLPGSTKPDELTLARKRQVADLLLLSTQAFNKAEAARKQAGDGHERARRGLGRLFTGRRAK